MREPHIFSIGKLDVEFDNTAPAPDTGALPLLVTRDLVLFPDVLFPITLSREAAITVASMANEQAMTIGVVCQRDPSLNEPMSKADLYDYGVTAVVLNIIDLPDNSKTAIVKAVGSFRINRVSLYGGHYLTADVELRRERIPRKLDRDFIALSTMIRTTTEKLLSHNGGDAPNELASNLKQITSPVMLVNVVATFSPIDSLSKALMLATDSIKERAYMLLSHLSKSKQFADIKEQIMWKTRERMEQQQREAFLHMQMETIRQELYGDEDVDIKKLHEKAAKSGMSPEVETIFEREIQRLQKLNVQSADYATQYGYLQTIADLPWGITTPLSTDFQRAEKILERDHYGLEKVKERVLEQLAVMMHNPSGRAPLICLVGAPGVGKTSLGRSIAEALGRVYKRVSLGGVHDESEIRGHRRTYIGALPGRIIDAIRNAETSNPLILLDEIDKLGKSHNGDPSAALLEVLDPEQNSKFHDNYVDIDFDLSKVMFIATANTLDTVPRPLIDRMEIIEMSGYLPEEKLEIARRHLIPKALKANNIDGRTLRFADDGLNTIIDRYTAESGVRQLEKEIISIVRKSVMSKMRNRKVDHLIDAQRVGEMLGKPRYSRERYNYGGISGVATGLAWTAVGGEILFIETSLSAGKGEKLTLTGNLGDVMKESAMIALQYIKANAEQFGVDVSKLVDSTIHIHVPEGAIPKDGPSAGITMATSILSTLTGHPVAKGVAMTGEITLSGRVLPVGGIKEKVLAAKRAGVTDIILCSENERDIAEIPANLREGLTFHYVKTYPEVAAIAVP